MNIYLAFIIIALTGNYAIQIIANHLNLKSLDTSVPNEFRGFYDEEIYRLEQELKRAAKETIAEAVEETIEEQVQRALRERWR